MTHARTVLPLRLLLLSTIAAFTPLWAGSLPQWTAPLDEPAALIHLDFPAQLNDAPARSDQLRYVILRLDPSWSPDWKQASFELKNLIVTLKGANPRALVGLEGKPQQIDSLMQHELAAYVDGYVFEDEPFIPDADETGKLWQKTTPKPNEVLTTLLDAASLGIQLVILRDVAINAEQRGLLKVIDQTNAGSLDLQPPVSDFPAENVVFFLDGADASNYYMAVRADDIRSLTFEVGALDQATAVYPQDAQFELRRYGERAEIILKDQGQFYFFKLKTKRKVGIGESLEIQASGQIDPYELVVRNQVFKDGQERVFQSLMVDELANYTYQVPAGFTIDISFDDTIFLRKDQPIERLRREFYVAGVKWRRDNLPKFPLIQPEKVQTVPLVVDLDKSYRYTYRGEDDVDGFPCWRVRFEPKDSGDFFSGTVWIDKETGAHRKIRAIQSGLEAPVIGNETTAFFDWREDNGTQHWVQVREKNLQIINLAGRRITLLIEANRTNFRFNRDSFQKEVETAYAGDKQMLRDTPEGFRYLAKKDGQRVVTQDTYSRQRAILGGVLYEPTSDMSVLPLAGFNYTSLDFLGRGWQANFFLAGAINNLTVSNPDLFGKGWDLTADVFLTPLRFGDSIYQDGEEVKELEVEELYESLNVRMGIPLGSFFKLQSLYRVALRDYAEGDDTNPDFVLPETHLEHTGGMLLQFSRERLSAELGFNYSTRSKWEAFGLPTDNEPLEDSWRTMEFNASYSKRLTGFSSLEGSVSYQKGWDQDRFSRFKVGTFNNNVSGFGNSAASGDQAILAEIDYEAGVAEIFSVDISLEWARLNLDKETAERLGTGFDTVDMTGLGLGLNFLGPWDIIARLNVGYGLSSDLSAEEGDFNGQLVFLRLF